MDLFSPKELYENVIPYLPTRLVSEEGKAKILEFASLVPGDIALSWFSFECPLGQPLSQSVDTSFSINISKVPNDVLREWFEAKWLHENLWKNLGILIARSLHEKLFEKEGIEKLWFEFDVASSSQWPPSPNVLLCFNPKKCRENSAIDTLRFFDETAALNVVEEILAHATRCHFHTLYVGLMRARKSGWIKLGLRAPSIPQILPAFLKTISYGHDITPLVLLIEKIKDVVAIVDLQLDVTDTVHPKISVECYIKRDRWAPFLEIMKNEGLVDNEEFTAISSWRGGIAHQAGQEEHTLIRYLTHCKIIYEPGKPLRTKVYLGAFPHAQSLELQKNNL